MNMQTLVKGIRKNINKVLNFVPTKLPVGMTEFYCWCDDIITTYDFPDNDSVRWTLATMILNSPSTQGRIPKRFFALCVIKAMSNQIAGAVFHDLKEKQKAADKAEQEAKASAVVVG